MLQDPGPREALRYGEALGEVRASWQTAGRWGTLAFSRCGRALLGLGPRGWTARDPQTGAEVEDPGDPERPLDLALPAGCGTSLRALAVSSAGDRALVATSAPSLLLCQRSD